MDHQIEFSKDGKKAFLCHSSQDKEFVRRLANDLNFLDVEVWFDEWELEPGSSLVECIGSALETSAYVIAVLSPDSVNSKWCNRELKQTLSREFREDTSLIIPVLIRDVLPPSFIEDKLYIDFTSSYLPSLTKLAAHIHDLKAKPIARKLSAKKTVRSILDVRMVLQDSGLSKRTSIGREDWATLISILEKHNVEVDGDRIDILNPDTDDYMKIS